MNDELQTIGELFDGPLFDFEEVDRVCFSGQLFLDFLGQFQGGVGAGEQEYLFFLPREARNWMASFWRCSSKRTKMSSRMSGIGSICLEKAMARLMRMAR